MDIQHGSAGSGAGSAVPSVRSTRPGFMPDRPAEAAAAPGEVFDLIPPSRESLFQTVAAAFDAEYHLARNPDVRAAGVDPLQHPAVTGHAEDRDPNRWFDTRFYRLANPDVDAMGFNPLWHYLVQGRAQGCPPRRRGLRWTMPPRSTGTARRRRRWPA